jgi:hypothetical protein
MTGYFMDVEILFCSFILPFVSGLLVSSVMELWKSRNKRPSSWVFVLTNEKQPVNQTRQKQQSGSIQTSKIFFWNRGKKAIAIKDIPSADPLRIVAGESAVLVRVELLGGSKASDFHCKKIVNNSCSFTFRKVEKNQGAVFLVSCRGNSDEAPVVTGSIDDSKDTVNHRIIMKDTSEPNWLGTLYKSVSQSLKQFRAQLLGILAAFLLVLTLSIFEITYFDFASIILLGIIGIFGLALGYFFGYGALWLLLLPIPKALRKYL